LQFDQTAVNLIIILRLSGRAIVRISQNTATARGLIMNLLLHKNTHRRRNWEYGAEKNSAIPIIKNELCGGTEGQSQLITSNRNIKARRDIIPSWMKKIFATFRTTSARK